MTNQEKRTADLDIDMHIDVQYALDGTNIDELLPPDASDFRTWVNAALSMQKSMQKESVQRKPVRKKEGQEEDAQLTIRIVDEKESAYLNEHYRHKNGPTNVLSFPAEYADDIPVTLLGDIILCAPLVLKEAKTQNKDIQAHWAHLTVHGSLHLLGYDHSNAQDAQKMESCEIDILKQIGFTNPYI